uniref:Uncharacterized protein n=1 Tax=Trichuris muris TaxID=70415 RepID=A0A5S6QVY9_TRIMR
MSEHPQEAFPLADDGGGSKFSEAPITARSEDAFQMRAVVWYIVTLAVVLSSLFKTLNSRCLCLFTGKSCHGQHNQIS